VAVQGRIASMSATEEGRERDGVDQMTTWWRSSRSLIVQVSPGRQNPVSADVAFKLSTAQSWRRGVVVSIFRRMNEVTMRRAPSVLGWVTVFGWVYHHGT